MKKKLLTALAGVPAVLALGAAMLPGVTASAVPAQITVLAAPTNAKALATKAAQALIKAKAPELFVGKHDRFVAKPVIESSGLYYAPYERTYRGLPVHGGDFVVTTNAAGKVLNISVAQTGKIHLDSIRPTVGKVKGLRVAKNELDSVKKADRGELTVVQRGDKSYLAWLNQVTGTNDHGEFSIQQVFVDATTGDVVDAIDVVGHGTGTGAYVGNVNIPTTNSSGTYSMTDPEVRSITCQDAATNRTFTGPDDVWGNGNATSKETACVDGLFATQTEHKMLANWLGRNGMDGQGGWVPLRVGLNDTNAFYDGRQVQIGRNTAGGWIASLDVVAHEYGHGVDDKTPGGISRGGTQEFVADTFGAATEAYANLAAPNDTPDYLVGEEINLVGTGPIRNMYDPSQVGDENCWSPSIATAEVHAAAGPGNHWFFLTAEGSAGAGQPASPTCNGAKVTGIGLQKTMKIFYNAMLMKTTSSSYQKYRVWTLSAAKNLYPNSCTEFNAVKAAWDAVSLPAQAGEPTCTAGGTEPTPEPPASGNLLANPGFEAGAVNWTGTSGPVTNNAGRPARTGSWKLWLGGNGTRASETISQTVSIPATATNATLSYWIRTDTAETGSTTHDTMRVQAVVGGTATTLKTFSNVGTNATYTQVSHSLAAYKGKSVTIRFVATEDASRQTSFVVDDTAVNVS